jgi:hypothetical protein
VLHCVTCPPQSRFVRSLHVLGSLTSAKKARLEKIGYRTMKVQAGYVRDVRNPNVTLSRGSVRRVAHSIAKRSEPLLTTSIPTPPPSR